MTSTYFLSEGSHDSPQEGRCAMEWVSYLAGEPHSDSPRCVSPVLRSFGISLNDNWGDEQRQKLRPYLARCIGTAGDGRDDERGWLAMDWLIREFTPAFLDLHPDLRGDAAALRGVSPVLSAEALGDAMAALNGGRQRADAAWAAAGDAAWAAAWAAARAAAGAAAAGDALQPTVDRLQASALDLFDRMLGGELIELPIDKRLEFEAMCGGVA